MEIYFRHYPTWKLQLGLLALMALPGVAYWTAASLLESAHVPELADRIQREILAMAVVGEKAFSRPPWGRKDTGVIGSLSGLGLDLSDRQVSSVRELAAFT
jgi:hypothetical protein